MNTKQSFLGQRLTDDCLARVQSAIGRELEPRDWRDISWDRKDFWKEVRLNPQYENPELLRIQEAVEEYISPWLNAIYETGDVEGVVSLLPEISLKSLSKITGLRVSQIRQTINEVGLSLDIPYSELTLVAEIIEGEISPKKVIREITYSSRAPGGGPVQRSRTQWYKKGEKSETLRRDGSVVRFVVKNKNINRDENDSRVLQDPEEISLTRVANSNYQRFIEMGPFYGKSSIPTFRVSAEPLLLPAGYYENYKQIGKFWIEYAKTNNIQIPVSFRLDTIIDDDGQVWVNELQMDDGAEALMVAEQMIYNEIPPENSSPFYYICAVCEQLGKNTDDVFNGKTQLKLLRVNTTTDIEDDPYLADNFRFCQMVKKVSNGNVQIEIVSPEEIVDLNQYDGYFDYSFGKANIEQRKGFCSNKLLCTGEQNPLSNKSLFADISGETEEYMNIPTTYVIESIEQFDGANADPNWVLKVYESDDPRYLECGKGVCGRWSTPDKKELMRRLFLSGVKFIAQRFIQPSQFTIPVKKGKDIEWLTGSNRVCAKYYIVNSEAVPVAFEATIGEGDVPAGRGCCFTAVRFIN